MAQQKEDIPNCSACNQKLQVKVKFCPFCGVEYIDVKRQAEQAEKVKQDAEAKRQAEELAARQAELWREKTKLERQKSEQAEQQAKAKQEAEAKQKAEQEVQVKSGKQLPQVMPFGKYKGKSLDQIPLDYVQWLLREGNIDSYLREALEREKAKQEEQAMQQQPARLPVQPVQPKKDSSTKYVVIAFIVILVVIFIVFNGDDKSVAPQTESAVKPDNSCETAINEINQHLRVSKPSRALTVIQIYQTDCKKDKQFIALTVTAENQANTAKAKLALAKEYLQKNNLAMAESSAKNAIEIDSELVGGKELLQEIDESKQQAQNAILRANENTQMQTDVIADSQNQAALDQARNQNSAEKLKQENLNLQKALQDAQRKRDEGSAEIAKQRAIERQKAEQAAAELTRQRAAERQKAEQAKSQTEQQFSSALSSANKALKTKNYGTAKKIAKEVLASSPNNSSALRVLRQAEEGESKAFDEMIIE